MVQMKSTPPKPSTKPAPKNDDVDAGKTRSSNISSISSTLSKHQASTNKSIQSVTKSISSVAKEQSNTSKQLKIREVGYSKGIKEVEKSMAVIMKKLGYTIEEFGRGAKKIAAQTAVATKDTLKQYSKAVGEDLNVNKQNMVAMALAKSSPIFGYFAAKFMETDVFQKAKERIKKSLADAFSVIGMKVKEWWTKGKEKGREGIDKIKTKLQERKDAKEQSKKIKIEKPTKEESRITKALNSTWKGLVFISELPFKAIGATFRGLSKAAGKLWDGVKFLAKLPFQAIGVALKGISVVAKATWDIAKFSIKLPFKIIGQAFKGIAKMGKFILTLPFKAIGAAFKGVVALIKAPFKIIAGAWRGIKSGFGLFGGKKKDNIPHMKEGGYVQKGGLANVHAAEVVVPADKLFTKFDTLFVKLGNNLKGGTGATVKEIRKLRFALVGMTKEISAGFMEGMTKLPMFRSLYSVFSILKSSIVTPLKFLFRPRGAYFAQIPKGKNIFANMGVILGLIYSTTQPKLDAMLLILQNIGEALTGQKQKGVENKSWTMFERGKDFLQGKNKDKWKNQTIEDMMDSLGLDKSAMKKSGTTKFAKDIMNVRSKKDLLGLKDRAQGEFGDIRKSMKGKSGAETQLKNIQKTLKDSYFTMKKGEKTNKGILENSKDQKNELTKIRRNTSDSMSTFITIIMGLGSILQGVFSKVGGIFSSLLSMVAPGLAAKLGMGAAAKTTGDIAGSGAAGKAKTGAGKAKKPGMFKKAGNRLKTSSMARVGGVVGGAMAAGDAYAGVQNAEEWGTSKVSAGIGGALGGTEGGASGAMSGMMKGAALGMVFGPIGAGIGGLAGGLLGLIGGKNIAKGLDWVWDKVKSVISSIVDVIMYPFKILGELKDKFMKWFENPEKTLFDKVKDVGASIMNVVSWPVKMIWGLTSKIMQVVMNLIPNSLKTFIPDFILKGMEDTTKELSSMAGSSFNTDNRSIPSAANIAEKSSPTSVTESSPPAKVAVNAKNEVGGPDETQCKCVPVSGSAGRGAGAGVSESPKSSGGFLSGLFGASTGANAAPSVPVQSGLITSEFGPRDTGLEGASKYHQGIDLRAKMGDPVGAMWPGKVSSIDPKWGTVTVSDDNDYTSSYTHLSEMKAKIGDRINKNDIIGLAGATGPIPGMASHLHLGVKDPKGNYIDPKSIFDASGIKLQTKNSTTEMGEAFSIPDIKESSFMTSPMDRSKIANNQSKETLRQTDSLLASMNSLKDTTENFLKENQKHGAVIMNNFNSSMNAHISNMTQGITQGVSKAQSGANQDLTKILAGNLA